LTFFTSPHFTRAWCLNADSNAEIKCDRELKNEDRQKDVLARWLWRGLLKGDVDSELQSHLCHGRGFKNNYVGLEDTCKADPCLTDWRTDEAFKACENQHKKRPWNFEFWMSCFDLNPSLWSFRRLVGSKDFKKVFGVFDDCACSRALWILRPSVRKKNKVVLHLA
jgi:hypothetical protein